MIKKLFFSIVLFFIFIMPLYAACSNQTLIDDAKELLVTANPSKDEEGTYYFIIKIENMKNNQVLVVTEDDNNTKETYKYFNTNKGTLELRNNYIFAKITYKVKIYSLEEECKNMLLDTKEVSTIKFNDYSKYDICKGNESFDLCKPFYNGKLPSEKVFYNAVEDYKKEEELSVWDKILSTVKEYYLYVIIPIIVFTVGYLLFLGYKKLKGRRK